MSMSGLRLRLDHDMNDDTVQKCAGLFINSNLRDGSKIYCATQCCILLLRVYAKYMLQETIRFMSQAKVSTQAGGVTKKEPISDT